MRNLPIRVLQGVLVSVIVGRVVLPYWPVVVVLVLLTFMYYLVKFKQTGISYTH